MVAKTGMEIKLKPFLFVLFLCFVCFSSQVSAECGGEGAEGRCYNKPQATKLKIIAIFAIFVTSMIGVCLPLVSRSVKSLQPDTNLFMLIKAFASGVILATGYMHVLPDSFNDLNSECLPETPWRKFPFTTFVAMVSAIFTLMVDSVSMSWHTKNSLASSGNGESDPTKVGHGHSHPHAHLHVHGDEEEGKKQLLRKRVVAQVLELGIVVHSVVIGLSLGTSTNPCTIRPLVAALCFHQLFEGMGLGGCILQAELSNKVKGWMVFFFASTTPGGIALGMALSNVYSEDSPTALIVVGLLNASSAGLLNYMALVDLLAADFMGPKLLMNMRLQFWAYLCVLLGAGGMSVMALWA